MTDTLMGVSPPGGIIGGDVSRRHTPDPISSWQWNNRSSVDSDGEKAV